MAVTTSAIISAAVALAGTAVGTATAVQQAENQRQQADYQSKLASRNAQQAEVSAQEADEAARQERREGYEAAQVKRQEAARIIGAQRAQTGASGAQTDAGSALDKNLDTAEKGELDALATEQQGQSRAHSQDMRAWSLRNQAAVAEANADFAGSRAETDYLGLSKTLLNGASRMGKNFYTIGSRGPLLP